MTTTPDGFLLVLAVMVPFVGVLAAFALGGRNAQRVAMVTILVGLGGRDRDRRGDGPIRRVARLRARRLVAAARHRAARRRPGARHDPRRRGGGPRHRRVRARRFRHARRGAEARAPFVFWTLLLAIWGALNLVFVSGRSLHALRRARAPHFRCRPARVARRHGPRRCAPRSATCCTRCSARSSISSAPCCSTARTARSTSSCWPSGSGPSRRPGGGSADDGGAARQDRALPAAPLAAAGARRRAGRRERGAVGAGDQGLVVPASCGSGSTCCRAW